MNEKELKKYAHKIGFLQPNCISWSKKQKIKKIMKLISKGVKTCVFENGNVGVVFNEDYPENWYRKTMVGHLALWLNASTTLRCSYNYRKIQEHGKG